MINLEDSRKGFGVTEDLTENGNMSRDLEDELEFTMQERGSWMRGAWKDSSGGQYGENKPCLQGKRSEGKNVACRTKRKCTTQNGRDGGYGVCQDRT